MAKAARLQNRSGDEMILDQWETFREIDPEGMIDEIDQLPGQLQSAWEVGKKLDLPSWDRPSQVLIAGMGGSAIGADLLGAYVTDQARLPVLTWRNYGLPAYIGEDSLVIASSHSGNTEEVLSAFQRALDVGTRVMAITTGGELGALADEAGVPVWRFEHRGQPRAAVGFSFGLLLAVLKRLGVIEDPSAEVVDAVRAMRDQQEKIGARVPIVQNSAKRVAGQLMGRWPTVLGADFLVPVARRWRTQISELAKAVAQFEELPEADHNLVAGVSFPEKLFGSSMVLFLRAEDNHPRNLLRLDVTRHVLMVQGMNTDVIRARGDSILAQQWTCLHFGDYVAYYLAMSYGADPTPVPAIEDLKEKLRQA
jgi:glucose/mannose-6-phosphate isomerase